MQGQAVGWQTLSGLGVCNCGDFVSWKRQNCLLGESRTMIVLLVFLEPLLTLVL